MNEHCKGCIRYLRSCTGLSKELCEKHKLRIQRTNADRIRAMSDEELAEFLLNRDLDVVEKASKAVGFTYKVDREPCLVNVIDWLKEEVSANNS